MRKSCIASVLLLAPVVAHASSAEPAHGSPARTSAVGPHNPVGQATPPLDLPTLEQRLIDTPALGVFTKLSLKNQVDDLLGDFRSFYGGRSKWTLVELRQKFELLLLKVVTLLQDDDPSLATAISSSREAIWAVLSDPKKLANL